MVVKISNFQSCVVNTSATIASGQTESTAIQTRGLLVTGFRFPASMDGTQVTLQESVDGLVWTPIRVNGQTTDFSVTIQANTTVVFENAMPLTAFEQLRIVSDATETADRAIGVLCRPV